MTSKLQKTTEIIADMYAIKARAKQLNIAWMILTALLLGALAVSIGYSNDLRDELAKPVRMTMQQRHVVIKAYLADGETRLALRQQIGCKEK